MRNDIVQSDDGYRYIIPLIDLINTPTGIQTQPSPY